MKVLIRVFNKDKGSYKIDDILEYDGFEQPEVVGLDFPIERCAYDDYLKTLRVYLADYPTRIDIDPRYGTINLLNKKRAEDNPDGYTLLDADKGKAIILWVANERERATAEELGEVAI